MFDIKRVGVYNNGLIILKLLWLKGNLVKLGDERLLYGLLVYA